MAARKKVFDAKLGLAIERRAADRGMNGSSARAAQVAHEAPFEADAESSLLLHLESQGTLVQLYTSFTPTGMVHAIGCSGNSDKCNGEASLEQRPLRTVDKKPLWVTTVKSKGHGVQVLVKGTGVSTHTIKIGWGNPTRVPPHLLQVVFTTPR